MKRRVESLLRDALTSCEAVALFVESQTFDQYLSDRLLRRGIERERELIGEALNQAQSQDQSIAELIPELHAIVGFRNLLIHGYHGVDNAMVWDIATNKAPGLADQLEAALRGRYPETDER
jgi:uncharacterized protein with HEPN domain